MCSIVGVIEKRKSEQFSIYARIKSALQSLYHRGPDSNGIYSDKNIGLGHTRLKILDLSEAGSQPMHSHCSRYVIVYNGETYNYKDIQKKLNLTNLKSRSDTEVILEAFALQGPSIIKTLNGMFSLAILDKTLGKLFLTRDRFGIKPLYFAKTDHGLFFASEIKGIQKLATDINQLNINSLHEWSYYGNTLGENTLFTNVQKLLPGHLLEIDIHSLEITKTRYWEPNVNLNYSSSNHKTIVSQIRTRLEAAVKRQLVSDVPVGIFLSGGIDSSAITAFASRHYNGKLATYSVGFDFIGDRNELPKAREIASKFHTDHHEIYIKGADIGHVVEKMVFHNDHPFSDAANIPLYLLSEKVNKTTKVILQGDGGDELFGGYTRYSTLSHLKTMKTLAFLGNLILPFMKKSKNITQFHRYYKALMAPDLSTTMALLLTVENQGFPPTQMFLSPFRELIETTNPFKRYHELQKKYSLLSPADQMLFIDSEIILPDIFLEKVDKATMAASIETRVPFLDNILVDYIQSIPASIKMKKGIKK